MYENISDWAISSRATSWVAGSTTTAKRVSASALKNGAPKGEDIVWSMLKEYSRVRPALYLTNRVEQNDRYEVYHCALWRNEEKSNGEY